VVGAVEVSGMMTPDVIPGAGSGRPQDACSASSNGRLRPIRQRQCPNLDPPCGTATSDRRLILRRPSHSNGTSISRQMERLMSPIGPKAPFGREVRCLELDAACSRSAISAVPIEPKLAVPLRDDEFELFQAVHAPLRKTSV